MMPSRDDCRKEQCSSADQQYSRILHRWSIEPHGFFDDARSNHELLRVSTEFLIGRIIRTSENQDLHQFWCDGVDFVHFKRDGLTFRFGGGCIFSDKKADAMWLAPFGLSVRYASDLLDLPVEMSLRLGHRDAVDTISRRYATGRRGYRLYAISHALYGSRPTQDEDWALVENVATFPMG